MFSSKGKEKPNLSANIDQQRIATNQDIQPNISGRDMSKTNVNPNPAQNPGNNISGGSKTRSQTEKPPPPPKPDGILVGRKTSAVDQMIQTADPNQNQLPSAITVTPAGRGGEIIHQGVAEALQAETLLSSVSLF